MQIKIISLNLGGYTNWQKRIALIASYLDTENPDVLLLQEVRYNSSLSVYNQAAELNSLLTNSYDYESTSVSRFYRPSVGEPYREGLAILSRFPIVKSEVLALTQAVDDKHIRLIQNVDLWLGDKKAKVSNVHFSNNKYSPEQLKELMDILSMREETRIIAGDFNIFDIDKHRELYKGYEVSTDFSKYVSFPSENIAIDYLLLPKDYNYQSITATNGMSDHAALSYVVSL